MSEWARTVRSLSSPALVRAAGLLSPLPEASSEAWVSSFERLYHLQSRSSLQTDIKVLSRLLSTSLST